MACLDDLGGWDACIPDNWDFEDQAQFNHGWQYSSPPRVVLAHTGRTSFGAYVTASGPSQTFLFGQTFPVGAGGDCPQTIDGVDREGKTFSAWIHFDNPPPQTTLNFYADTVSSGSTLVKSGLPVADGWTQFSVLTTGVGKVRGHQMEVALPAGTSYSGNVMIDDVAWR
jgi:hypothetical protein